MTLSFVVIQTGDKQMGRQTKPTPPYACMWQKFSVVHAEDYVIL